MLYLGEVYLNYRQNLGVPGDAQAFDLSYDTRLFPPQSQWLTSVLKQFRVCVIANVYQRLDPILLTYFFMVVLKAATTCTLIAKFLGSIHHGGFARLTRMDSLPKPRKVFHTLRNNPHKCRRRSYKQSHSKSGRAGLPATRGLGLEHLVHLTMCSFNRSYFLLEEHGVHQTI